MKNYHDRDELSSSQIAAFLDDPIKFYHQHVVRDWPKDEPTPAMRFGTAVHRMIELGGWEHIVREIPADVLNADGHCKGRSWTDWKAANAAEQYLKPGERNPFAEIMANLQANQRTSRWLNFPAKSKEVQHFWTDEQSGIECRGMFDVLDFEGFSQVVLVDWKTTTAVDPRGFQREICDRNYDIRLAFYRRGVMAMSGHVPDVVVIAIQNQPGYAIQPYEIPREWLDEADEQLMGVMNRIDLFRIENELDRPILTIEKPRWRFNSSYELERA